MEEDDDDEVMPGFSEAGNKKDMEFIESNYEKDFVDVEEFSEEEKEDYTIKKTDAVIIGAKIEKGYSCLEVVNVIQKMLYLKLNRNYKIQAN